MRRHLAFIFVGLLAWVPRAGAEPIVSLNQVPGPSSAFTPGDILTFDLVLDNARDLHDYQVAVVVRGSPGADIVTTSATRFVARPAGDLSDLPDPNRYVFAPLGSGSGSDRQENEQTGATVSDNFRQLTIFDGVITPNGVDTIPGANDLIARLSLRTDPLYRGADLTFSIATGNNLILLDSNGIDLPTPTVRYNGTSPLPIVLTNARAVPEPASLVLMVQAVGVVGLIAWWRRRAPRSAADPCPMSGSGWCGPSGS